MIWLRAYDRMISGLAVPYGVVARQNGHLYCYTRGSFVWDRVKLLIQHDNSQQVGRAVELTETNEGLFARFLVTPGPRGDRALALVADGIYSGLSVGLAADALHDNRDGIFYPSGLLVEVSLTPQPLFADARISRGAQ